MKLCEDSTTQMFHTPQVTMASFRAPSASFGGVAIYTHPMVLGYATSVLVIVRAFQAL
jgi:hypothetical protein